MIEHSTAISPELIAVELADTAIDRNAALFLRETAYRTAGLVDGQSSLNLFAPAVVRGSAMFIAKLRGRPLGTISIYADSPLGLPIDAVHGDEVNQLRESHSLVAEVGGLAVALGYRGRKIGMLLFRAMFKWAAKAGIEYLVACTNPVSRRVYSDLLLFDVLGECKSYGQFRNAPSIPLGLSLADAPERYMRRYGGTGRDLYRFFCVEEIEYEFASLDARSHLQWTAREISNLIEEGKLALDGENLNYVKSLYGLSNKNLKPK